jgi:HSP20 family protein
MSIIWRDRDQSEMFMPLRQAMDRLMEGSFLWPGRFDVFSGQTFPIDVYESPDKQQYVVEATVPGFKPDEIQITAQGGALMIQAARKEEKKEEKGNYVRRERYEGEMSRTVAFPGPIDEGKVEASYENGVLTVRVPKAEGARPRQIPVKVKGTVSSS